MTALSIGELARRAGVRASAIRYWERIGVLPAAPRRHGRRRYTAADLRRLAAIRVAQRAGLTLGEIRALRTAPERGRRTLWRATARRKLLDLDAALLRLQASRQLLERGIACECRTLAECELLD